MAQQLSAAQCMAALLCVARTLKDRQGLDAAHVRSVAAAVALSGSSMVDQLAALHPTVLMAMIQGFAALNVRPHAPLTDEMARMALGYKSQYSVSQLCNLAACLAQLADLQHATDATRNSPQCAAFLQGVDKEVLSKHTSGQSQLCPWPAVQDLLKAHAQLQRPISPALNQALQQWLATHVPQGAPRDLAGALHSISSIPHFGTSPPLVLSSLERIIAPGGDSLSPQPLCELLQSLAAMRIRPPTPILERLLSPLLHPPSAQTDGQTEGTEGQTDQQTAAQQAQHDVTVQQIVVFQWAAAYFGLAARDANLQAALQRVLPALKEGAEALTAQESSDAVWSLAYVRCSDHALMQQLSKQALTGGTLSTQKQQQVCQAVHIDVAAVSPNASQQEQQALMAAIFFWQRFRQSIDDLLPSIVAAMQALKLNHYTEDATGLVLLRVDFGNYRNVAVLAVPPEFCSMHEESAADASSGDTESAPSLHRTLGIFQVAFSSALARGLHCAPLNLGIWSSIKDLPTAAQYLLQQLVAATSPVSPSRSPQAGPPGAPEGPAEGPQRAPLREGPTSAPAGSPLRKPGPLAGPAGSPQAPGVPGPVHQQYTAMHQMLTHASTSSTTAALTPAVSGFEGVQEEDAPTQMHLTRSGGPEGMGGRTEGPSDLSSLLQNWQAFGPGGSGTSGRRSADTVGRTDTALGSLRDVSPQTLQNLSRQQSPGIPGDTLSQSTAPPFSVFHSANSGGFGGTSGTRSTTATSIPLTVQDSGFTSVTSAMTHVSASVTQEGGPSQGPLGGEQMLLQQLASILRRFPMQQEGGQQGEQKRQGEGLAPPPGGPSGGPFSSVPSQQGPAVSLAASPFQLIQSEGTSGTSHIFAGSPGQGPGSASGLQGDRYGSDQLEAVLSQLAGMCRSGLEGQGHVQAHSGDLRTLTPESLPAVLQSLQAANAGNLGWASSLPAISSAMQQLRQTQQQQQQTQSVLSMLNYPHFGGAQSMPISLMTQQDAPAQLDMAWVKRAVLESTDTFVWAQLLCGPQAPRNITASDFLTLLRDLVDMQQVLRARQLFEWSRTLPADHTLRQCNNADDYNSLLLLCVQWQSLDHAVSLLNEMHKQQLQCGVRVFVSLLRAAGRSNRLEMVVLLYNKMLAQPPSDLDYTPFHLMMEAYLKVERFSEAIEVLRDIERCNMQPDLQSYNTVLAALSKAGRLQQALQLYSELRGRQLVPNVKTFLALGPAFNSFTSSPNDAISREVDSIVLADAIADQTVYMALLGSCEKAGQWTLAIHLLNRMASQGTSPTKAAYNSLIAACAHAGEWRQAEATLKTMVEQQILPDAVSYASMIRAYKKGSQWCSALFTFESMLSQQLTVHSAVYSSVIDLLWQTCNPWAQTKAKHLFTEACRSSAIPAPTIFARRSVVRVEVHALAAGTALLAVLQWLISLQEQLQQGMSVELLSAQKRVAVSNGDRSTRGGQSSMLTAIRQLLETPGSPFRYVPDPHAGRLEATTQHMKRWLLSPAFHAFIRMYNPDSTPLASNEHMASTEQYLQTEQRIAQQVPEAFHQLARQERAQRQRGPFARIGLPFHGAPGVPGGSHVAQLLPHSFLLQRAQLTQYTHQLTQMMGLSKHTAYASCALLDHVMLLGMMQLDGLEPAMVAACLAVTVQQEGMGSGMTSQISSIMQVDYNMVMAIEQQIRRRWQHQNAPVSAFDVLQLYSQRLDLDAQGIPTVFGRVYELLDRVLMVPDSMLVAPTVLASAIIAVARRDAGAVPLWPSLLATMTGYSIGSTGAPSQAGFGSMGSGSMDLTRVIGLVEQWLQGM